MQIIEPKGVKTRTREKLRSDLKKNGVKQRFVKERLGVYGVIILHVVLYGCENASLTLMEEKKVRAFENRVLRKLLGSKGEE